MTIQKPAEDHLPVGSHSFDTVIHFQHWSLFTYLEFQRNFFFIILFDLLYRRAYFFVCFVQERKESNSTQTSIGLCNSTVRAQSSSRVVGTLGPAGFFHQKQIKAGPQISKLCQSISFGGAHYSKQKNSKLQSLKFLELSNFNLCLILFQITQILRITIKFSRRF